MAAPSGGSERSERGGLFLSALLIAAALILPGCATIVGDNTQALPIKSTPAGAEVVITDEAGRKVFRGITPTEADLPKSTGKYWGGKRFQVQVGKEGHFSRSLTVTTRPNGWYLAGNLVFGGAIGWFLVDPWNGRMYSLSPDGIEVTLPPVVSGAHLVQPRPPTPPAESPSPGAGGTAAPAPAEATAPASTPTPATPDAPAAAPTPAAPAAEAAPPAPTSAPAPVPAAPASAPAPSPSTPPPPPPDRVPPIR